MCEYNYNRGDLIEKFKMSICNANFESKLSIIDSLNILSLSKPRVLKPIMSDIAKMLDDEDWRIRKNTLDLIGNVGITCYDMVKEYIEKIVQRLEDNNPNVVCSAAYSIVKITSNSDCQNKLKLINQITEKITNKYILTEIFKNISEIQPNIIKECLNENILKLLDDNSEIIKINILKIFGNVETIDIDRKTAEKITLYLYSNSKLKKYATYAVWNLSKKYPDYFRDSIGLLINNLSSDDKELKVYSLLALGQLCYLEPQKFENLDITGLLNDDEEIKKALLYLLHNLSLINSSLIINNIWKIYPLLDENNIEIVKSAIGIIGNIALYNQKYITACLNTLNKKISNPELRQDITLALIKGKYLNKEVLLTILTAIESSDLEFLKEVIEYYPPEFLDTLQSEIKKLKTDDNVIHILNLLDEKKKNINWTNITTGLTTLEGYEGLPVVVALKSECAEVELEDGKKTYIIPKDCCIETSLSNLLLNVIEMDSKNEVELCKLTHEIMIKSLIEEILCENKKIIK